ncbi:MAG: dihydropteroate synthase [Myxococcales bacterium]
MARYAVSDGASKLGINVERRYEVARKVIEAAKRRRGAALMGVCNVTPNSFSDGGLYASLDAAKGRVDVLVDEGADLVDIGGESTRPGAPRVPTEMQLARVLDVVRHASKRCACVSIDTSDSDVAERCLEAGATVVNDASCLRDVRLAEVAGRFEAAFVLMHARGSQEAMSGFGACEDNAYVDVVADVLREWRGAAARAVDAGVAREALLMDPGFGFAKNARHARRLLVRMAEWVKPLDVPVVVGVSRKSFLTSVDRTASPTERLGGSLAAGMFAVNAGVSVLRVHDVRATRQALDLVAWLEEREEEPDA